MQIIIHSHNMEVTPGIRAHLEKRLQKLSRYFDHIGDVEVHTSEQRSIKTTEVTVHANGRLIRAEEHNADIRTAIDHVTEKLEKQVKQYKERMIARSRRPQRSVSSDAKPIEASESATGTKAEDETSAAEPWPTVVRRKTIPVERMPAEEAAERMQMLGHDFYMYLNEEGKLNVVYERLDGNYGVLEPVPEH